MQKLVFINGNNVELELTSGNYGITNWEGFSNAEINIQSQQVPYNDGSVYLDALLENRELTVTVAIYDGNDLAVRYEKKRELISVLNAKEGEGYLYYTNDYLSRRIKVIPHLPIFENKNANDAGTLKASVTFTACIPYWEDVEERSVTLKSFQDVIVSNEGDVPCGVDITFFNNNNNNFCVKNNSTNEVIKIKDLSNELMVSVNTNIGKKNIKTLMDNFLIKLSDLSGKCYFFKETNKTIVTISNSNGNMLFLNSDNIFELKFSNINRDFSDILYSSYFNCYLAFSTYLEGNFRYVEIYRSDNLLEWVLISKLRGRDVSVFKYNDINHTLIFSGENIINDKYYIRTSSDLINFSEYETVLPIVDICFNNNIFLALRSSSSISSILSSTDGIIWTSRHSYNSHLSKIKYIPEKELYIAIANDGCVILSEDIMTWNNYTASDTAIVDIIYISEKGKFLIITNNYSIYISDNAMDWNFIITLDTGSNFYYVPEISSLYIYGGYEYKLYRTNNLYSYEKIADDNGEVIYLYNQGWLLQRNSHILFKISKDLGNTWQDFYKTTNSDYYHYVQVYNNIIYSEFYNKYYISAGKDAGRVSLVGGLISIDKNNNVQTLLHSSSYFDVACIDNLIIICGYAGYIYESTDGENFVPVPRTMDLSIYRSICISPENIVVVGDSYYIRIKNRQTNEWSENHIGFNRNISICYSSEYNIYVILSKDGYIRKSSNLVDWEIIYTPDNNLGLKKICYKEGKGFVAVGDNGVILFSPDGANWDLQQRISENLSNVVYSEDYNSFVAVGDNGVILFSPDGANWNLQQKVSNFNYNAIYVEDITNIIILNNDGNIFNLKKEENYSIIDKLENGSNLDFKLKEGENSIYVFNTALEIPITLNYRQKYLGV